LRHFYVVSALGEKTPPLVFPISREFLLPQAGADASFRERNVGSIDIAIGVYVGAEVCSINSLADARLGETLWTESRPLFLLHAGEQSFDCKHRPHQHVSPRRAWISPGVGADSLRAPFWREGQTR
jgi:hypothetical protein